MINENKHNAIQEDIFKKYLQDGYESSEDVYIEDGENDNEIEELEDDFYNANDYYEEYYQEQDEELGDEFDNFDDSFEDIDFSEFKGDFKQSLKAVDRKVYSNKKRKPLNRKPLVKQSARNASPTRRRPSTAMRKPIGRKPIMRRKPLQRPQPTIEVKDNKEVLLKNIDNVILSKSKNALDIKNIGYYKGEKLKELVFTMANTTALPFTFELFNPSMPLDYLHSTSLNLNNKIQVAGGIVSYSDILFNILANPTIIYNAKFVFAGATYKQQMTEPLVFKNKNIEGKQKVHPMQISLQMDNLQYQDDIVFFNLMSNLNRPFIPNGMDVMEYTVYAGNTVTFAFFVKQVDLRSFFFKEAKTSKILI